MKSLFVCLWFSYYNPPFSLGSIICQRAYEFIPV